MAVRNAAVPLLRSESGLRGAIGRWMGEKKLSGKYVPCGFNQPGAWWWWKGVVVVVVVRDRHWGVVSGRLLLLLLLGCWCGCCCFC